MLLKPVSQTAPRLALLPAAFLVELYEVSVRYRLPDMEFALYTGDQVGCKGGLQGVFDCAAIMCMCCLMQ
jgi:hypothetical protein